jgi:8-oxo-dGTP pyrophosphatase MutT (NUDIX family)
MEPDGALLVGTDQAGGRLQARAMLLAALKRHSPADGAERASLEQILRFLECEPRPFARDTREGHLTGSAIVVSAERRSVVLLRHPKLARWLQPGGHAESGEDAGEAVALREGFEETGISGLALFPGAPCPLDVDVHQIPPRAGEPAHLHLDLRYLVASPPRAEFSMEALAAHEVRWVTFDQLAAFSLDPGLLRALAKASRLLRA